MAKQVFSWCGSVNIHMSSVFAYRCKHAHGCCMLELEQGSLTAIKQGNSLKEIFVKFGFCYLWIKTEWRVILVGLILKISHTWALLANLIKVPSVKNLLCWKINERCSICSKWWALLRHSLLHYWIDEWFKWDLLSKSPTCLSCARPSN